MLETLKALGLALLATAIAAIAGVYAETSVLTLLVLLAEPLLWFALGASALYALVEKRWGLAAAALWSLAALAIALRQPVGAVSPPAFAPDVATALVRNCASLAKTPQHPLKVLTWNLGHDSEAAPAIVQSGADLVVLQEVTAEQVQEITAALQEQLLVEFSRDRLARYEARGEEAPPLDPSDPDLVLPSAEGLHMPGLGHEGLGLVISNGEFSRCGDYDRFPVELPAGGDRRAQGALVFATFGRPGSERSYDLVPLLGVDMDRPSGPGELAAWPERIARSAEAIAGFARALDTPNLIVAGDTNTHGTFRSLPRTLKGAGLISAPPRASWPASLHGVPTLPLYQLDRVWYGDGWMARDVRTLRGNGDHLGVLVTLDPSPRATAALR